MKEQSQKFLLVSAVMLIVLLAGCSQPPANPENNISNYSGNGSIGQNATLPGTSENTSLEPNATLPIAAANLVYSVGGCQNKDEEGVRKAPGGDAAPQILVDGSSLRIFHNLSYACCANITLEWNVSTANGIREINILEVNNGSMCKCMCTYEVDAKLGPFQKGKYTANVYGVKYQGMQTSLLATENIEILTSLAVGEGSAVNQTSHALAAWMGEEFNITLSELGAAGYTWLINIENESIVQNIANETLLCGAPGTVGGACEIAYKFKALKKGSTTIHFVYKRPWENETMEKRDYFVAVIENDKIITSESVNAREGDEFSITLKSKAGYGWGVVYAPRGILDYAYLGTEPVACPLDASCNQTLRFIALGKGEWRIYLSNSRMVRNASDVAENTVIPLTILEGSPEKGLCMLYGGKWREFPNGCVDSCESKKPSIACTMAITLGCDCGEAECWDENMKDCVAEPTIAR